jgi:DNA-binding SARP family transcriptional activator
LAEAVVEYRMATELYRGDFLEEDLYEDWPNAQREHLRQIYLERVDQLSEYYLQQGKYPETIALCQKMLAQDNCHEEAHRRLMRCYQSQGQRHLAVRQYQLCVQALRIELDVPPLPETQKLYEQITTA